MDRQKLTEQFASIALPAFIGLLAGIGHGITSHNLDLPFSLTEQLTVSSNVNQY